MGKESFVKQFVWEGIDRAVFNGEESEDLVKLEEAWTDEEKMVQVGALGIQDALRAIWFGR
jgi:hypothetical protein